MRRPVRVRRTIAGYVVPLLLTALAACDSTGETYTIDTLLPAMKAAVEEHGSTHMVMDIVGAGQRVTAEGDVSYDGPSTAMAMTMGGAALGGRTIEMRVVDGLVYMSMPPMTPEGKFLRIDPDDPNDPYASMLGNMSEQQLDPLRSFDAFEAGLRKVTYVGEESVQGEDLDRYRLNVDFDAAAKAQGLGPVPAAPKTVVYDMWLDGEALMRRVEFELLDQVSMVMTLSEWGEPVTVEAPPRSQIFKGPRA